jgi:hypothetical protein
LVNRHFQHKNRSKEMVRFLACLALQIESECSVVNQRLINVHAADVAVSVLASIPLQETRCVSPF